MRVFHWGLVGAVALFSISCSGQSAPSSSTTEESNAASPSVEEQVTEPFEDAPLVESEEAITEIPTEPLPTETPPLFAPTSPEQRAAQVDSGRPDPFASLNTTPRLVPARVVSSQPQPHPQGPVQPLQPLQPVPISSLPNLPPPPVATVPIPVQSQPPVVAPGQAPIPVASPQVIPAAVPAIQTVEVNGVVTVGGNTRAIVTVPDESSGRSVSVGDRIANGQVLVKRIDVRPGSDPIVVLEQNGVEITHSVSLSGS